MVGRRPVLAMAFVDTGGLPRSRWERATRPATPPTASAGGGGGGGGGDSVPRTDPSGPAAVGVSTPRIDRAGQQRRRWQRVAATGATASSGAATAGEAAAGGRVGWERHLGGAAGGAWPDRKAQAGRGGPPARRRKDGSNVGGRRCDAPFATPSPSPLSSLSPCVWSSLPLSVAARGRRPGDAAAAVAGTAAAKSHRGTRPHPLPFAGSRRDKAHSVQSGGGRDVGATRPGCCLLAAAGWTDGRFAKATAALRGSGCVAPRYVAGSVRHASAVRRAAAS